MQGCTTYIQPSQGCVHLAKDNHKVVCTLQMLMQGCHKLAATLQGCCNLEISIWVITRRPWAVALERATKGLRVINYVDHVARV